MMASSRGGHHHSRSAQSTSMTKCGKCCYYCRQVTTFLFSHIGLCTLLLGYALMGAFTFQALEYQHEQEQRLDMIRTQSQLIIELSNMTNHSMFLNREHWIRNATNILNVFEKKFLHAVKFKGYDGSDEQSKTSSQWSFSGALLYSIIVITTIGYGNVAPRTDMGKIVTILYAIIGIPLMLFCLSNIGHAMAHSFKFIYWKCCCYLCVKPKKLQRRQRRRRRLIRQQRQRAMMVLSQQPNSAIVENVGNMGANGANQLMPTTPMTAPVTLGNHLNRTLSGRSSHFRFPGVGVSPMTPATDQNCSSSFTSTPAATPLTGSSAAPIFFSESSVNPNGPLPNHHGSRPKKSNLSRSASARYHNESVLPQYVAQFPAPNAQNIEPPQVNTNGAKSLKDRVSMSGIICNKYASLSDECIDAYRNVRNVENGMATQEPLQAELSNQHGTAIQLRNPPRRTPSQVRFQPQSPPDLNISSPSPEPRQQVPPPPPFPYPSGAAMSNGEVVGVNGQHHIPPPPFHSSYYHGGTEDIFLDQSGQYTNNYVPPYHSNYADQVNQLMLNKEELDSDLDSDSDDENIAEKNIPITVCLTLVVGYICGGAWFFSTSEEWSFLDASYFCFVTLSTIGFGDLVPGRTVLATTPEEGQMTLAICALYLLFGMALLAMSLNLVKEKVTETVRIIGQRIGILVSDDDDYY